MQVHGIDERLLSHERRGGHFLVFVYEGSRAPDTSWSVHSRLITDADLPEVLRWLGSNLPPGCCWSLGVVREPADPSPRTEVDVSWIVGADVLNMDRADRSADEQRIAEAMLARGHRVDLT